jgi:hypothetical protein
VNSRDFEDKAVPVLVVFDSLHQMAMVLANYETYIPASHGLAPLNELLHCWSSIEVVDASFREYHLSQAAGHVGFPQLGAVDASKVVIADCRGLIHELDVSVQSIVTFSLPDDPLLSGPPPVYGLSVSPTTCVLTLRTPRFFGLESGFIGIYRFLFRNRDASAMRCRFTERAHDGTGVG